MQMESFFFFKIVCFLAGLVWFEVFDSYKNNNYLMLLTQSKSQISERNFNL